MHPYLLIWGNGWYIPTYGALYALSGAAFFLCAAWLGRKEHVPITAAADLTVLYGLAMTTGAAASYDLMHGDLTLRAFSVSGVVEGGLQGGPGVLVVLIVAYGAFRPLPVRALDVAATALPAALTVAKIGCYLNGCCYGAEFGGPWAVAFPEESVAEAGVPLHPVQVYDALLSLGIFAAMLWGLRGGRVRRGWGLPCFVVLFCACRSLTESLRHPDTVTPVLGPLAVSQLAMLAAMLVSAWLLTRGRHLWDGLLARIGGEREAPALPGYLTTAPFGRRAEGMVVDLLGVTLFALIACVLRWPWEVGAWVGVLVWLGLAPAVLNRTPGMAAAGLRLVGLSRPLSTRACVLRAVGCIASAIPLGLGFVRMLWDPAGQCFHDVLGGTAVVECGPRRRADVGGPVVERQGRDGIDDAASLPKGSRTVG